MAAPSANPVWVMHVLREYSGVRKEKISIFLNSLIYLESRGKRRERNSEGERKKLRKKFSLSQDKRGRQKRKDEIAKTCCQDSQQSRCSRSNKVPTPAVYIETPSSTSGSSTHALLLPAFRLRLLHTKPLHTLCHWPISSKAKID